MTIPFPGIDYQNQPLVDAWWTPGWTSQNQSYIPFSNPSLTGLPGFPPGLTYLSVIGNFFDLDGNPLSGFLTFWPSTALTFNVSGGTAYLPQRYAGTNLGMLGLNQFGNGKQFLWNGQLVVNLLATNNSNQIPTNFTYHVVEHFFEGNEYDISLPANSVSPIDIHNLIIPGSLIPPDSVAANPPLVPNVTWKQAVTSTEFVPANISTAAGGMSFNPTQDVVQFAFILNGSRQPQASDWVNAQWATTSQPYIAQVLVGIAGGVPLTTGTYVIWVKVIATPQVPVIPVGYLIIF